MLEKPPIARAQIIQARFAIGRLNKSIFGTLAMTHPPDFALLAIARQGSLRFPERDLRRMFEHFSQRRRFDVSEQMLLINIMIAGKQVAVALDDRNIAARRAENAQ